MNSDASNTVIPAAFNRRMSDQAGIQFDLAFPEDVKVKMDDQSCGLLKIASGFRRDDGVRGA